MSATMPALFIGHGSPMNAIEDNEFSRAWAAATAQLPRPTAVLCISAHWETDGTMATAMEHPRTIHDFAGFPRALAEYRYPARGSAELAEAARRALGSGGVEVALDHAWGLDHGAWSVLCRLYPHSDVPVVELSLDRARDAASHYELGKGLGELRDRGVLILGSGNIVHNLALADFGAGAYDWAASYDTKVARWIEQGEHGNVVRFHEQGREALLSVNSAEHYEPLLYVLALQRKGEAVSFFADKIVSGSLSMRSVRIG